MKLKILFGITVFLIFIFFTPIYTKSATGRWQDSVMKDPDHPYYDKNHMWKEECENGDETWYWDYGKKECSCKAPYVVYIDKYGGFQCMDSRPYVRPGSSTSTSSSKPTPSLSPTPKSSPTNTISPMTDNYESVKNEGGVSISGGSSMLKLIKEGGLDDDFLNKLLNWGKQLNDDIAKGAKNYEFKNKVAEENALKEQLAVSEQILKFSMTRQAEALGEANYNLQSDDYKSYWGQAVSGSNDDANYQMNSTLQAADDITTYTNKVSDIKTNIDSKFPAGWQSNYINTPKPPTPPQPQKMDQDLFNLIQNNQNQVEKAKQIYIP